jgi:hypothetical protein
MIPRACDSRFLKIVFDLANGFRVGSARDKIVFALAQPAMKSFPHMLSVFWMMVLKLVAISAYGENAPKLVTCWLRRVAKLVSRMLATADGFESSISLKYNKWTTYAKEWPIHSSPPKKVYKSLVASDKVEWLAAAGGIQREVGIVLVIFLRVCILFVNHSRQ